MSPEHVIAEATSDLDRVAPTEFASFNKVLGREDMIGDRRRVRRPDARPVGRPRGVVDRKPTSFRVATLDGHLGPARSSSRPGRADPWSSGSSRGRARGDRFSNLLYDRLRMSKEIELHMWTSVFKRVPKFAGGRLAGAGSEIRTRRVDAG